MKKSSARAVGLSLLALSLAAAAGAARAQGADTVLVNGRILTLDERSSIRQAVAVRDGKILALGNSADIRKLAGPKTRVIDLRGRTVIPGLIDSHIHAMRAGLSYATEVNWIGAASIEEALARIRGAARTMKPGAWIIVAGGWTPLQFQEKRRPTQAELAAAAPDNPAYVQLFYEWALLTPLAMKALKIASAADLPPGARLDVDSNGRPTGGISGRANAITALFDRLPQPNFEQQVEGTRRFFRELNRLGLTGVIDPGGRNITMAHYQPLFKVWQDRRLTVRVAFSIFAQNAGKELEEFQSATQLLPMGFGDDMLRFIGIGESVTLGMYDNDKPTDRDKEELYRAAKWAAERRMGLNIHWRRDQSVGELLGVFERLNKEVPIAGLRWTIAHLHNASEQSLRRMKALGIGWAMQNALYYGGETFLKAEGADAARRAPPIKSGLRLGVVVGGGTDAHRVASYNPFTALRWMLDGKTVAGTVLRGPEETPSREEALRIYTLGSAWLAYDEHRRGSLNVGKLADLAVLSRDYMKVPVEQVGEIESLLTMVGGRIVYASGPFARFEDKL